MSEELKYLSKYVATGKITRRYFMGRAAALGITVPLAKTMLDNAARAQAPIKGEPSDAESSAGEQQTPSTPP